MVGVLSGCDSKLQACLALPACKSALLMHVVPQDDYLTNIDRWASDEISGDSLASLNALAQCVVNDCASACWFKPACPTLTAICESLTDPAEVSLMMLVRGNFSGPLWSDCGGCVVPVVLECFGLCAAVCPPKCDQRARADKLRVWFGSFF